MLFVSNELTSLFLLDIFTNLASYIKNNFLHDIKHLVLGHSNAVLRKWNQLSLISNTNEKQQETIAPELPILSIIPTDLQPDQSPFAWHKLTLPKFQSRLSFCVYSDENVVIKYMPYLYTVRMSAAYVGRSYPDIIDAKVYIEDAFDTRHVKEFEMTTLLVFPPSVLENTLTPEQIDHLSNSIPKENIPLINQQRYVIPYQTRYFVRLVGQSDNSRLFGDQALPEYMISYDFEIYVNLPTKLFVMFNPGKIETIDLKTYTSSFKQNNESTHSNEKKPDTATSISLEVDPDTGSYLIHTVIQATN